jgi:hypothetical protein
MNRRDTFALSAGLLGAAALASPSSARTRAPARQNFNLQDPLDVGRMFRRLAFVDGAGFGIWWLKGRRYCAVPPNYIPMWDMLLGQLFTVRDLGEDSWSVTSMSTTFYTDIATGELISAFHNPVTGKDLVAPALVPRASERRYGPQGQTLETSLSPIPGTTATHSTEPGPAFIEGDDVWLRSDNSTRAVPTDVTRQVLQVEDLTTYFGSLADVSNPDARAIPAGQVFTDLLNYPAWLEMGDRNGHFFSRCFGRKVFSTAAMPADWQRLMAKHHPEILRDPLAALTT